MLLDLKRVYLSKVGSRIFRKSISPLPPYHYHSGSGWILGGGKQESGKLKFFEYILGYKISMQI